MNSLLDRLSEPQHGLLRRPPAETDAGRAQRPPRLRRRLALRTEAGRRTGNRRTARGPRTPALPRRQATERHVSGSRRRPHGSGLPGFRRRRRDGRPARRPHRLRTPSAAQPAHGSPRRPGQPGRRHLLRLRPAAPGRPGKLKCSGVQEFAIGGFTDPSGSRIGFGALLLGHYGEYGRLRYAGKVGTGFDTATLRTLRGQLDHLTRERSPFYDEVRERAVHWVRPELVAQVAAFTEWTSAGMLRHPRYLGLRDDKPAREVTRERPAGSKR